MYAFILIMHLIICLALIGVVLIQSGKGGGLAGGAFGGSAQTVFGGRGATDVVTRATMVLGGLFFLTSIVLALMTTGGPRGTSRSLVQEAARKSATTQPAQPGGAQRPPTGTSPSATPEAPPAAAPSGGTAPAPSSQPAPTTPSSPGGR
jgi:preprotein translocase subunit SecG